MAIEFHGADDFIISKEFGSSEFPVKISLASKDELINEYRYPGQNNSNSEFSDDYAFMVRAFENGAIIYVYIDSNDVTSSRGNIYTEDAIIIGPKGVAVIVDKIDARYNNLEAISGWHGWVSVNEHLMEPYIEGLGKEIDIDPDHFKEERFSPIKNGKKRREYERNRAAYKESVTKAFDILEKEYEKEKMISDDSSNEKGKDANTKTV